ncbi:MAG: hypothetical protein NTW20_07300 [Rhodobacterales bacterium]|nr:hypothetical protein [Rhodobacterales bacterium]
MHGTVLLIGLVTVVLSAAMTWGVARRYGRSRALIVPLMAVLSVGVLMWRASGMEAHQAMGMIAVATVLAGASMAGALIGVMLSRLSGK